MFRRGSTKDLSVAVVEFETEPQAVSKASDAPASAASKAALGLVVVDLTESQRKDLKVRGGVKVESAEGVAARAGLRAGDVVLAVDNVEISNVRHFGEVASKAEKLPQPSRSAGKRDASRTDCAAWLRAFFRVCCAAEPSNATAQLAHVQKQNCV